MSRPITVPVVLTSGPPESPACRAAFVRISLVSCSAVPVASSVAVIVSFRPVTVPAATAGVPPLPPALPRAITFSPMAAFDELLTVTVLRPDAPLSCSTAISPPGS